MDRPSRLPVLRPGPDAAGDALTHVERRIAGISGRGERIAPERHLPGQARERSRDHRPYGRQDAQEPHSRSDRRQGSRRNDPL